MNKNQFWGVWLIVGILALMLISMLLGGPNTTTRELSYSDFIAKVKNAEIKSVELASDSLIATPVEDKIKTVVNGK